MEEEDEHAADHGPVDALMPSRPGTQLQRHCYVCKKKYTTLHPFYDQLCPECGEFNFRKRTETADLRGRVALLTGGRVKIAILIERLGIEPEAAASRLEAAGGRVREALGEPTS